MERLRELIEGLGWWILATSCDMARWVTFHTFLLLYGAEAENNDES